MKKRYIKGIAGVMAACMLQPAAVYATQEKIDRVQDEIQDLQKQEEEAQEKADSFSREAGGLEGDLAEFNQRLTQVTEELNATEAQLKDTRRRLEKTKKALKEARGEEKSQYKAMKERIRFMYEMDTRSILEVFLSAEDFADFLNKAEYISSIYDYDRQMLEEYRDTKKTIAARKQELADQEASLASLKERQEAKEQEVAKLVSDTSENLAAAREQLAAAKADAAGYAQKLKKQKEYEAQLEKQKAKEDARRMEEIRRQEEESKSRQEEPKSRQEEPKSREEGAKGRGEEAKSGQGQEPEAPKNENQGGGGTGPADAHGASDLSMLAALIQCEAGGESYEGKLAVGSVVMNRVSSGHFPNTVAGVICQSGQFSPVASGRFASVLACGADPSSVKAAGEVLGGRITVGYLYFRRDDGSIPGTVIGGNVFY